MTDPDVGSLNLSFVEGLYESFLRDPGSVSAEWRERFEKLGREEAAEFTSSVRQPTVTGTLFRPASLRTDISASGQIESAQANSLQDRVDQLLRAYRLRGHVISELDPLGQPRPVPPELNLSFYGFTEEDLDRHFSCETMGLRGSRSLREIYQRLRNTYCRSIGVEYMHIDDVPIRRWFQARMEGTENRLAITRDIQLRILTRLTDAVMFEEFIRKKFVGAKSFSLEGSESLIPLLDLAIEKAADQGVKEIVLGMAHRGRLNVLANIMGKHPKQIFREFADVEPERYRGRGDVKYHLGHSTEWLTASGRQVHLSLCFNPSHLEFVNPVVLGRTRANQDRTGDIERTRNMALLIHGDAGFAGQGMNQEIFNLSQLAGYAVGGTLHVVVNNQIGFTTSPSEGRSTMYATDVAKMLQIPIFHVNGEDPEAVAQVVQLAMDFRQIFQRDVIIDVYGYRRLGHNEGDEPSFTQPVLYRAIEKRKPVREGYLDHLLKLGGVTREEADQIAEHRREHLEKALSESRRDDYRTPREPARGIWSHYVAGPETDVSDVETGVPVERLSGLLLAQARAPQGFHPHPKLKRLVEGRRAAAEGKQPLDWGMAEAMAFASLAVEGYRIRMSGQDCRRGTFSHRHAVLYDYEDGRAYMPLQHLSPDQGPVEIWNSPLSEMSVLGFEYGYSLEWPDGLVVWEAQFGDFFNVAQVIIDQFLASAEKKWQRYSGLVLLLPHGFEGQGPEHSSARLERFMALAAEDNIQVVYPTTPAQFFHLLRRQVVRGWRKPLVVMSPKSLLRHPRVVSSLQECAGGTFQRIIPDSVPPSDKAEYILLCSGKIFYELEERREKLGREDVALLRIEQLYPLPDHYLDAALSRYREGTPVIWVQEEPENMGAWRSMRARFGETMLGKYPLSCLSRPASASPATGSASSHKLEQEQLLAAAFAFEPAAVMAHLGENGEHVR
jgi:2-oxoglutarate dehydrogenase E1 component